MQKKSSVVVTPWRDEEKASLAIAIGRTFDLQKQYGKTSWQIENIVAGFLWALQPYPHSRVMQALAEYIRRKPDMPTPSDLVVIMEPPPKVWHPDKSYYVSLKEIFKNQGPYGLDEDEAEYIRKYEEHMQMEMKG